ncbi:glyoxalase bleomycin resistance protein dioxygenase superfamily [Fusarium langsethiae]|uniref:Glyoxalase bleomycin resistance protein dioxygenase superfamily n=1 Tax=Fusarium langsethiae TaxID=179993 RepID=A0A0M9ESD3_FUSLA|nr:glyoxalase bleomycin resistance protein dioxygenase superfamily [Fusarium langsethiae]GKU05868.1 unnamed protein product [Fusarium langsethiae]GKU22520.1 unnamed protein product [Fusarium langsethiae]
MTPTLDHIVVLVSYETLQQLPKLLENDLIVIDGGTHADGRTVNKLIEFSDGVYIELIAFQEGLDPEQRKTHRWGKLKENTIVDWAYTLPNEKDFGVIQKQVMESNSEVFYHLPVSGGRLRPDGVELKWSVASAYNVSGQAVHPGKVSFWCLDRTERNLRVTYQNDDGSQPSYTKHPSGAVGVSSVSVFVPQTERDTIAKVYTGIHGSKEEKKAWRFIVHSGSTQGKHLLMLENSQDGERHIHLALLGDKGKSRNIEIVPGVIVSIEADIR